MDEKYLKNFMLPVTILMLLVLTFLIVRSLVLPVLSGLILAYIFYPLYTKLYYKLRSKNIASSIVIVSVAIVVILPIILIMPLFVDNLFKTYVSFRNADLAAMVTNLIPSIKTNAELYGQVLSLSSHFNSKLSAFMLDLFQSTITNLPAIAFGLVIVLFTFFFALREGDYFKEYLSILLTLPKEYEDLFFKKFGQVTNSVIYGQMVIGVIQGLIAGIGYFMFGIPNAMLLTVLTTLAGVIPVIGPWLVWIPADLFLFLNGQVDQGVQLLIFGLFCVNWIDTLLSPHIVAKHAQINPAIALIGSIGGVYAFGVIGIIIGPLVLAYLILIIEIYRDKRAMTSIIIKENKEEVKK